MALLLRIRVFEDHSRATVNYPVSEWNRRRRRCVLLRVCRYAVGAWETSALTVQPCSRGRSGLIGLKLAVRIKSGGRANWVRTDGSKCSGDTGPLVCDRLKTLAVDVIISTLINGDCESCLPRFCQSVLDQVAYLASKPPLGPGCTKISFQGGASTGRSWQCDSGKSWRRRRSAMARNAVYKFADSRRRSISFCRPLREKSKTVACEREQEDGVADYQFASKRVRAGRSELISFRFASRGW